MDSVLNEKIDSTIEEPCPNPFIQGAVKGLLETDLYQQKDINTLKKRVISLESDMQAVKQRFSVSAFQRYSRTYRTGCSGTDYRNGTFTLG